MVFDKLLKRSASTASGGKKPNKNPPQPTNSKPTVGGNGVGLGNTGVKISDKEELELALAISKSEADEKELQRERRYGIYRKISSVQMPPKKEELPSPLQEELDLKLALEISQYEATEDARQLQRQQELMCRYNGLSIRQEANNYCHMKPAEISPSPRLTPSAPPLEA